MGRESGAESRETAPGADSAHRGMRGGSFSALLEDVFNAAVDGAGEVGANPFLANEVVGRFKLIREIGRGGFGIVYEARDLDLKRAVAFKAVKIGSRLDVKRDRLLREAEAAAQLSHPNIVTLLEAGRSEKGPYLILELLRGRTLAERLRHGKLSVDEALRIATEVAKGLAHAHAHGVVHRDLTPGNVFLCDDGQVKVLDFGMAHAFGQRKVDGGTPAYTAPEQRSGAPEDERTDVFALGVVLFEELTGTLPFRDAAHLLSSRRAPLAAVPEAPNLRAAIGRMLEKDPRRRPRDGAEVLAALADCTGERQRATREEAHGGTSRRMPSRRSAALAIVAVAAVAAALGWFARREARIRWAVGQGLPRVAELVEREQYGAAFALAEKVEREIPDDATLARLWPRLAHSVAVETAPAGADVYVKQYGAPDASWRHLGRSPIERVRLPLTLHQWRIEKAGFATIEAVPAFGALAPVLGIPRTKLVSIAGEQGEKLRFELDRADGLPHEMVHVRAATVTTGLAGLNPLPPVRVGDFLIDRTEVTNKDFQRFVDARGYRDRSLWKEPFVMDGRELPWGDAMALFHDRTGRPGPAGWESGAYPEGEGDLPVTGVSWYEAAAYARLVGKQLPNVYQWSLAAGPWGAAEILPLSNFQGRAVAPVTARRGLGPFGTYDMAGNAKEWCWNAMGAKRLLLGGAWNEPSYMFYNPDAQSPFARAPNIGFRLVKPLDAGAADPQATSAIARFMRDYTTEQPVAEDVFRAYKRLYAYDRGLLDAKVEATDDSSDRWRKEKVSFAAAYGGERVIAYLFTPRGVAPPLQTVVFFPGVNAMYQRSSDDLVFMNLIAPVVRSGRAVLYPVYKSTYERGDELRTAFQDPTAFYRDHVLQWSKDLGRTIDYAETRQELDRTRIALYGVSWGAKLLPLLAAVEDRVRLGVMVAGGLHGQDCVPEADPFNFAPYLRRPVLMVNGRYDFIYPVDTAVTPLFALLGSPPDDKRHVVLDTGHFPPSDLVTKEVLTWMDRYFGPTG
jgi:formylglycine-generating enzyme required for sulfatase activity/dienelactone hydrolase